MILVGSQVNARTTMRGKCCSESSSTIIILLYGSCEGSGESAHLRLVSLHICEGSGPSGESEHLRRLP